MLIYLIAAIATSGLQAGAGVQDRSSNQGLFMIKGHNKNFSNTLPNQVNKIPFLAESKHQQW
jgi:hypothetical protein